MASEAIYSPTIHQFAEQHPLNIEDVLSAFNIKSIPLLVAILHDHEVTIQISPTQKIIDKEKIGSNAIALVKLRDFLSQKGIQLNFDMANIINEIDIHYTIWVSEKPQPFFESIKDVLEKFSPSQHNIVGFIALTLAYDQIMRKPEDTNNYDITVANIWERDFLYQDYKIPPLKKVNYSFLVKNEMSQTIPNFGWHAISSPAPSPGPMMNPSPIPTLLKIPEESAMENVVQAEPENTWKQQGRLRHQKLMSSNGYVPGRQLVGASDTPPISVPVGSTYNGKPTGGSYWVMKFDKFFKNGETGIGPTGVKIPENDRLRRYTAFVIKNHPEIEGKKVDDPKVIQFLKAEMKEHFVEWNKYDWTKINLKEPFPENPPLKA